ncbi:MAG: MarR family winged helix-turn-helix transcriptional regulator [Streptosporangiaceae bacterium]
MLVAVKGHRGDRPPTVGDLAGYLLLRPHSAVELVDRVESAGLVERTPDREDGRVVRVRLTKAGDRTLQRLTRAHLDRLDELAAVLNELVTWHGSGSNSRSRRRRKFAGESAAPRAAGFPLPGGPEYCRAALNTAGRP